MDQMVGKKIQEFTCHFLKFSWFHLCIVRSTLRIFPNSDIHLGIFPLKVDQLFSNLERRVMLHDISVAINKRWPTSWRVLLTGPPKYIVPHPEDHYHVWVCMHVDWGKLSNTVLRTSLLLENFFRLWGYGRYAPSPLRTVRQFDTGINFTHKG